MSILTLNYLIFLLFIRNTIQHSSTVHTLFYAVFFFFGLSTNVKVKHTFFNLNKKLKKHVFFLKKHCFNWIYQ